MREVGRSRSKANFDQRAERKLRAQRKNRLQADDGYWTLADQLASLREDDQELIPE
jgi:hypothetical protein